MKNDEERLIVVMNRVKNHSQLNVVETANRQHLCPHDVGGIGLLDGRDWPIRLHMARADGCVQVSACVGVWIPAHLPATKAPLR